MCHSRVEQMVAVLDTKRIGINIPLLSEGSLYREFIKVKILDCSILGWNGSQYIPVIQKDFSQANACSVDGFENKPSSAYKFFGTISRISSPKAASLSATVHCNAQAAMYGKSAFPSKCTVIL